MSSPSSKSLQRVTPAKSSRHGSDEGACHESPKAIVVDNSMEYHSRSFTDACKRLGMDIIYRPVTESRSKGRVERSFGRVSPRDQMGGEQFCSEIRLDCARLDVFFVDVHGKPIGRPWMWFATGVETGAILATELHMEPLNRLSVIPFIRKLSELTGAGRHRACERPARGSGRNARVHVRPVAPERPSATTGQAE